MKTIAVGKHKIGPDAPPFIIAEMSGNHNQSLKRALAIVDAVAQSGVQALKLQTYTADTMTLNLKQAEFFIRDRKSLWKGHSLYQLYQRAHTPWEWHKPIFERARAKGLLVFSTPFDATAVDFLESLHVPLYKIASFENADLPLIERVAQTGKPLIISTGMASHAELKEAVHCARRAGARNIILLKCTSAYPAPASECNLRTMAHMRDTFGCQIGLSDHTLGLSVSLGAVALGATVIERHVTLRRKDGGVDSAFSLEPMELKNLMDQSKAVWQAMGRIHYGPTSSERGSMVFRRSLYIAEDVKPGDVLTPNNLRAIRPGFGLAPKHYRQLIGKKVRRAAKKGTAMRWELVR